MLHRSPLLALGVSILLAPTLLLAEDHEIGTRGAQVALGDLWTRTQINPELGKDQFIHRRKGGLFGQREQVFLAILEFEEINENERDCAITLDTMVTSMDGKDPTPIEVVTEGGTTRASRSVQTDVGGMRILFRLVLIHRAGLSYVAMAWGTASQAATVEKRCQEFVDAFTFPAEDSPWGARSRPIPQRHRIPGHSVEFSMRETVFGPADWQGEWVFGFASPDASQELYGFDHEDTGPDAILDAALEVLADEFTDLTERGRRTESLGGRDARVLTATGNYSGNELYTLTIIGVPLDDGRVFEVRHISPGSPEDPRADRDLLLRTLRISSIAPVLEFPEIPDRYRPPPVGPAQRRVLEIATRVGDTGIPYVRDGRVLPDGDLLLTSEHAVARLDRGSGEVEWLLLGEDWGLRSAARCRDQWWVSYQDGTVGELVDGRVRPTTSFSARLLAASGDDLILVRQQLDEGLLGLGPISGRWTDELVRRSPDGSETILGRFRAVHLDRLVADASGSRVLLVGTTRPDAVADPHRNHARLIEVTLEGPRIRELGSWDSVAAAAPLASGWLVTGRPAGRPLGIHRLEGGETIPLSTGAGQIGIGIEEGHLIFTSDRAPLEQLGGNFVAYRIALDALAPIGPLGQPFSAELLTRIAETALDRSEAAPRTAAEIRAVLDRASEEAERRAGAPLPATAAGVDALLDELTAMSDPLGLPGSALVSMLIARSLLDAGATWVEGAPARWEDWVGRRGYVSDNAFAVGHDPVAILHSCLFDEEGYLFPATGLVENAYGRRLLLAIDRGALAREIEASVPAGTAEILEKGDSRAAIALLRSSPKNEFLRSRLYRHFGTVHGAATLLPIARSFTEGSGARSIDRAALLSARLELAEEREEVEDLTVEILAAITAHPDQASFYLLLGAAYERVRPDEPEYARVCYERVRQIESWGPFADEAERRLEALD